MCWSIYFQTTCRFTNRYPESKRAIFKWFKELAPKKVITPVSFIHCDKCKVYFESLFQKEQPKCSTCKSIISLNEKNFFVYFGLRQQVYNSIIENWKNINIFTQPNKEIIRDFNDGRVHQSIRAKFKKANNFYLPQMVLISSTLIKRIAVANFNHSELFVPSSSLQPKEHSALWNILQGQKTRLWFLFVSVTRVEWFALKSDCNWEGENCIFLYTNRGELCCWFTSKSGSIKIKPIQWLFSLQ